MDFLVKLFKLLQWWCEILFNPRRIVAVAVDQDRQSALPVDQPAAPAHEESQPLSFVWKLAVTVGGVHLQISSHVSLQVGRKDRTSVGDDAHLRGTKDHGSSRESPTVHEGHDRTVLMAKQPCIDLSPMPQPDVLADGEASVLSSDDRLGVTSEELAPPVSSECFDQKDEQGMTSTRGEDTMDTSLRESVGDSGGREARTVRDDDGEVATKLGRPHASLAEYSKQADGPKMPGLAGDQTGVRRLCEEEHNTDEREVLTAIAEVVSVDEKSSVIANGCSHGRDSQKQPLPTREDPLSVSLRGTEDYDGGLEARASSEDGETAAERDELHASSSGCDQGAYKVETSAQAGDQAAIAHVHKNGSSAGVLGGNVSADEKLRVLSCRCSKPVREDELRLPQKGNVITYLLRNKYNCSIERARTQLEKDEEERARQWEEAAGCAGVKLEQRRVEVVYADEKAMDDVEVEVPRQVKYVGTKPAIPTSLADAPCADLGVDAMLQYLNCLLLTTYTLDQPGLSSVLQSYIDRGFDFGLAYGHIRLWWFEDFTQLQETMRAREMADKARRDRAIVGEYIVDRELPPRRAWDLYSNRVLPWWAFRRWHSYSREWMGMENVDAVSHSWVHPDDRQSVWTPINGYQWPVPIPKDTSLDQVRVELLNVGIEVIWLDVLCLWQDGVPKDDAARLHEWELDVPTIGNVYQSLFANTVVTYFNGLGRSFRIGNLDDELHWLNRAWTLQEFKKDGIIGGLVPGSFPPSMGNNQVDSDLNVIRFYHRLQAASNNNFSQYNVVLSVLAAMGPRHAAHIVDKVGGITHVLTMGRIPKYIRSNESSAAENAWDLLIPVMDDNNLADLFFLYPARGNGKYTWCPSWVQVNRRLPPTPPFALRGSLEYSNKDGRFECQGWLIKACHIQGFAKSNPRGRCRTGTLRVVHDGAEHSFTVAAHHQVPIPDGSYVLVGDRSRGYPDVAVWAVGTFDSDKRFEKVSVLRTEGEGDIETLEGLGLIGEWYDALQSIIALV